MIKIQLLSVVHESMHPFSSESRKLVVHLVHLVALVQAIQLVIDPPPASHFIHFLLVESIHIFSLNGSEAVQSSMHNFFSEFKYFGDLHSIHKVELEHLMQLSIVVLHKTHFLFPAVSSDQTAGSS